MIVNVFDFDFLHDVDEFILLMYFLSLVAKFQQGSCDPFDFDSVAVNTSFLLNQ